ncbi:type II toxin-antitoxin system VapB family antitoxin [Mesorhizobium onobrychidis]|uniref:Type II toxin-antitoxin system VapB family antitoxin n=1 Tax=Mesorhizobium onobrychidis TaxID=2775404 RepID=A0ABY5R309_9HYPH|nr:type II toxin-antitoxin system VapB family antitoxin [Mesorhizobium onobrychidis]UVC17866.1 type II toxin-antitoxin system VapB family antitoxin [Mesorhizobium onobrychidis]
MALLIKNVKVEQLARELARCRGVSVTEAIPQSLERLVFQSKETELVMKLRAISDRAGRIPKRDNVMTEDEILGYDELGIPTR